MLTFRVGITIVAVPATQVTIVHHLLNVSQKTDETTINDNENLFKDQDQFIQQILILELQSLMIYKSFKYKAKLLGNTEAELLLVMLMKF